MSYRPLSTTSSPAVSSLVREDLTSHVKTWPADILAKQVILNSKMINNYSILFCLNIYFKAQKLSEEAHILGSVHCSRVSAELKYARSIVRLTEVQASLLEHK